MTEYGRVFKAFLSKIQDPLYAEIDVEVAEDDLISLMDAAILNFEYPKVDLKDKDDDSQIFYNELGFDEIQLLSHLMVLEWMKRELRSIDTLRQFMTTKDFNTFSQANHVNALARAEEMTAKDLRRMKVKYSMREGNRANLASLGGDGE